MPAVNPLSVEPINEDAYHHYKGDYRGGAHRNDHHTGNLNFNLDAAAAESKGEAVREIVNAIVSAGNADQIALALRDTLLHHSIQPFTKRIIGNFNSERSKVGMQAIDCMRTLVDMIVDKRDSEGRTKESDAFLKLIGMCVVSVAKVSDEDSSDSAADDNTDTVSMRAIHRQIFASLSLGATSRLLKKACKKRKRFEEEELKLFRCVELEEIRWKYTEEEIESLRKWTLNTVHGRTSPCQKDVIKKRDLHSK